MFQLGAILFDAYGTLFDLASALRPHAARLGDPAPQSLDEIPGTQLEKVQIWRQQREFSERSKRVLALWRQKQLEYTWTATIQGEYRPFDEITRRALEFALKRERTRKELAEDPKLADALMDSFTRLEPVNLAESTLQGLKSRGLQLGILSNGSPDMLLKLLGARKIATVFDVVLSVEAVRAYKPDRRVYQLGVDAFGLPADEIGFVTGNAWDAAGAAGFGFDTYWIGQSPYEYGLERKAHMIEGIYSLPDALP